MARAFESIEEIFEESEKYDDDKKNEYKNGNIIFAKSIFYQLIY